MKLCQEFDAAIKALNMHEFLRGPIDVDLHNIEKLHCNALSVNGMLGLLDCSHKKWKIFSGKHGQAHISEKKTLPQLFLRELWTITCFLAVIVWLRWNTQQ